MRAGSATSRKGSTSEAAIEFTNAVQIDPNYADAHFQLAESYLHLQQRDRAYQELTRTVELRPEDYRARMELTTLLILARNFQEAQEQADLLLKKRPDDPGVHALASSLLAAQEQNSRRNRGDAENDRARSGPLGALPEPCSLANQEQRPDAAEASFKKVIELNPKAMQAGLVLGNFYQSQKRFDEAEKQFRDALTLDPNCSRSA